MDRPSKGLSTKGWCGPASARQLWLVLASIVSFNLLPGELASNWPCLAAHSYSINSSAKAREAYNRDILVVLETGHTGSTIEGRIQNFFIEQAPAMKP